MTTYETSACIHLYCVCMWTAVLGVSLHDGHRSIAFASALIVILNVHLAVDAAKVARRVKKEDEVLRRRLAEVERGRSDETRGR